MAASRTRTRTRTRTRQRQRQFNGGAEVANVEKKAQKVAIDAVGPITQKGISLLKKAMKIPRGAARTIKREMQKGRERERGRERTRTRQRGRN
jgi:hypothetical protein